MDKENNSVDDFVLRGYRDEHTCCGCEGLDTLRKNSLSSPSIFIFLFHNTVGDAVVDPMRTYSTVLPRVI